MKLAFLMAAALAPALASAADFAGTWKIDNTFNGKIPVLHCNARAIG